MYVCVCVSVCLRACVSACLCLCLCLCRCPACVCMCGVGFCSSHCPPCLCVCTCARVYVWAPFQPHGQYRASSRSHLLGASAQLSGRVSPIHTRPAKPPPPHTPTSSPPHHSGYSIGANAMAHTAHGVSEPAYRHTHHQPPASGPMGSRLNPRSERQHGHHNRSRTGRPLRGREAAASSSGHTQAHVAPPSHQRRGSKGPRSSSSFHRTTTQPPAADVARAQYGSFSNWVSTQKAYV